MPEPACPAPAAPAEPSGGVPASDPIATRLATLETTVAELGDTVAAFDGKLSRLVFLVAEHTDRELAATMRGATPPGVPTGITLPTPPPLLSLVPSSEAIRRRWSLALAGAVVAVVSIILDRYGLSWVVSAFTQ